jgi:hypothetical protein
MRLSHTVWAAAAFAAAGIGYFAGVTTETCPPDECYTAIPAASEEESDGPRLTPAEPIDLSCVEPVLPYDLFAHTSEPPLAGPSPLPADLRPVGFEFPDLEAPILPQIPTSEGDASPGKLPAGLEREGTELPTPLPPSGTIQTVSATAVESGSPSGGCPGSCCPCCQCPCCAKAPAEPPAKPLPPGWFVGPPAPDGWVGPE